MMSKSFIEEVEEDRCKNLRDIIRHAQWRP